MRSLRRLGLGLNARGSGTPIALPPADWRMPATTTTSGGLSGSLAALQTAQATSAAKTVPSVTIGSGATEYIEWTVAEAGTLLLSFAHGGAIGTITITKNTVSQSFAPIFPSGGDVAGNGASLPGRRQHMKLAVAANDVIRLTCVAGAAARTLEPLLHKIPATGPWNAILVAGASREDQGCSSKSLENNIRAVFPNSDPVVFNYAFSGATIDVLNGQQAAMNTAYVGSAYAVIVGSAIGNNVSNSRPYDASDKTTLDPLIDTFFTGLSGYGKIYAGNQSYRAYTAPDTAPATQLNGSREYNDSVWMPKVLQYAPHCYSSSMARTYSDEYLVSLDERVNLTDEVHGNGTHYAAIRAGHVDSVVRHFLTNSWGTAPAESRVAEAEAAATTKATALTVYTEATYAMTALSASSAKTAWEARLATIYPTVLFYEAIRLIDAAEIALTQLTKDAAQDALDAAVTAGYTGGTSPNTVTEQQARIDAIVITSYDQIIRTRLGSTTAITNWNSFAPGTSAIGTVLSSALVDETGTATTVGMEITNAGTGNSNNTGMVSAISEIPTAALTATWTDTSNAIGLKYTGLEPARVYDLVLLPCRSSGTASNVRFTVNGIVRTPDKPSGNNQSDPLYVTGVSPTAGGEIEILAGRGTGSSFAYFTVPIIKRQV
jgi:hypothetical protein